MPQPDEKQRVASPPAGDDEALPLAWRRLLAAPKPAAGDDGSVLGFFVEVMPEEGAAFARVDVAPVLLTVAEHGRYSRPVPLDSRHLVQTPLQPHEQRLAASVLGLPLSVRKSRSYARLGGHVGDSLLARLPKIALDFQATIHDAAGIDAFRDLAMPRLVLEGEDSTPVAHRICAALGEIWPDAQRHVVRGAGHMAPVTHADAVNRLVSGFIAALPA